MTNIAQQLLDGSAKLNRMKGEIDAVVKMVLGMIEKEDLDDWTRRCDLNGRHTSSGWYMFFRSSDCEWGISYDERRKKIYVRCALEISSNGRSVMYHDAYTTERRETVKLEHILRVHGSLDVFIRGMKKEFPALKERWQPLLDVSG